MQATSGSSKTTRLENAEACAVLADREQLRLLGAFLGKENTISSAAQELEVNPTKLYKQVQRFLALGLVNICRLEKRSGRAIKYYRSSSDRFFIPFRTYPPELIGQQNREHHTRLFAQGLGRVYRQEEFTEQDWGAITASMPGSGVYLSIANSFGQQWDYLDPDAPAVVSGWHQIQLDFEDAKAMQREMVEVMLRYMGKGGKQTYLLGLFLTNIEDCG
jgi:predicted transcriptional regulator